MFSFWTRVQLNSSDPVNSSPKYYLRNYDQKGIFQQIRIMGKKLFVKWVLQSTWEVSLSWYTAASRLCESTLTLKWKSCYTDNLIIINSLALGRSGFNFKSAIFNLALLIGIFRSSYDNALSWMTWDLSEDKSTLVQVMAWCRQATSHYLSQCWPRSVSPYGVIRAQWVKGIECHQMKSFQWQ